MKVKDFIEEIAQLLSEDFTYNPLWTEDELFKDLRVVIGLFSELTMLVDKCQVCLVDYLTGEMTMPEDFGQLYFGQYSQEFLDLVDLNELEFLSETWMAGSSGSPKALTVFGQGSNKKGRFVPVPTAAEVPAGGGTGVSGISIASSPSGTVYELRCYDGVLVTSMGVAADPVQVIEGFGSYWDLGVNDSGVLTLTASSSSVGSNLVLNNAVVDGRSWSVYAGLGGVLTTDIAQWGPGLCTGVILTESGVDTYQDFNSNYGIIVDAYADGVSSTPSNIIKLEGDFGFTQFCGQYEGCGTLWYKGLPREVYNVYTELCINDGLLPVLKHGVLARAYSKDGDGKDMNKSKLLVGIFLNECRALKETFGKRW